MNVPLTAATSGAEDDDGSQFPFSSALLDEVTTVAITPTFLQQWN